MEITNDTFGCSRATQVLVEAPETVNLTEFCPRHNEQMNKSPCFCSAKSTIKPKIADEKNLQLCFDSTTKLARELVLHGEQNQGHSAGEVCWKYLCIVALVLIYESKMDQN